MTVYIDTSVILRYLLKQAPVYRGWGEWDSAYTSGITKAEAMRAIDRMRLLHHLSDEGVADSIQFFFEIWRHLFQIDINKEVVNRASEPHPTVIATLDSIHLASAYMWQKKLKKNLIFLTHDNQLGIAAKALGFEVQGLAG